MNRIPYYFLFISFIFCSLIGAIILNKYVPDGAIFVKIFFYFIIMVFIAFTFLTMLFPQEIMRAFPSIWAAYSIFGTTDKLTKQSLFFLRMISFVHFLFGVALLYGMASGFFNEFLVINF